MEITLLICPDTIYGCLREIHGLCVRRLTHRAEILPPLISLILSEAELLHAVPS